MSPVVSKQTNAGAARDERLLLAICLFIIGAGLVAKPLLTRTA